MMTDIQIMAFTNSEYELVEIGGVRCLYTFNRLPYPDENPMTIVTDCGSFLLYRYDTLESSDGNKPICEVIGYTLERHGGTIISRKPIQCSPLNPDTHVKFTGMKYLFIPGYQAIE